MEREIVLFAEGAEFVDPSWVTGGVKFGGDDDHWFFGEGFAEGAELASDDFEGVNWIGVGGVNLGPNGTGETCENLNPTTLTGHNVNIQYDVDRGRRFRLTDIRITGTNRLSYEDVAADLKTQKANAIGLIPFLGYGRGYTSLTLLEQDRRTVEAFMRDLGYRRASAQVLQGVSVNADNLIITFQVNEGPLTRIAGVEVKGNKIYTDDRIHQELKTVIGAPYSRSQARADGDRVAALYAREGYINARVDFSVVELPKKADEEQVRLIYSIADEGDKVFINQIIINGVTGTTNTRRTKRRAIRRAIPIAEGDVILQPTEMLHFQNCDQCSDRWWKLRQEAKRRKHDGFADEKSA